MATPIYQGQGQPTAASGGFLGRLGSYFGGSAPAYAYAPVADTPAPTEAPAPKPTTMTTCPIDPPALAGGQIAIVVPVSEDGRIAIDPDAVVAGQVAFIVPRSAFVTQ